MLGWVRDAEILRISDEKELIIYIPCRSQSFPENDNYNTSPPLKKW